ncbi:MAG: Cache 3/Cache 2 fusion domain-containing protein [Bacteroidales bacterium]|nr:Cache 3/Cache 2 fusion domain-containing protein [Bacteroidales bacterium]MBR4272432.1 Cache 3/Cache 2 fusion domain-containing protein [Bacteroidales bacterium]
MKSKKTNSRIYLMVNILVVVFFTILFGVLCVLAIHSQDRDIRQKNYQQMDDAINDLRYRLETENNINSESVSESLRLFVHFMRQSGQITQEDDSIGRQTTNFETGETSYERIPRWTVRGKDLSSLNSLIENVYSLTGAQSAIYQKIPEGYLIMTSNFDHSDRQLLSNVFIPNTSAIVPTIENGEIYSGNITIFKKQYVAAFFPLFLNTKISGMISCMKSFGISKDIESYVKSRVVNESGYLFMMSKSAGVYVHPDFANSESLSSERMLNKLKGVGSDIETTVYKMPEKDFKVCQKAAYIKEFDVYIGACCPEDAMGLSAMRKAVIITIFVLFGALATSIVLLSNWFSAKLFNKVRYFIYQVAEGKVPKKNSSRLVSKFEPQELVDMEHVINEIIDNQHNRIDCLEKLISEGFDANVSIERGKDFEGDLLLKLQEKLADKETNDQSRKVEIEHSDWINKGITKFIEILRFHGQERKVLAYNIISNLVKYVGAIQGAIYFTNEEDPDNIKLELSACYAYEKQKLIEQTFSVDDGLLGRAYHENRVINLTDLPPGYIKIVSGLGDAQPNNLIIVPLIFNQKNSGMLELASFKVFEEYQVTFLSRIAESIASAISGLKISERTETLLQRSQEQSKLMKIQEVEMRRNLQEMRRLKDEAESKDSEMRGLFRAVDSTSLVTQYDKDGTILHVNSRMLDLLQVSEDDLVGRNHADISSFKPNDKNYRKFWEDLRHGQSRSLVESINTKQKTIWMSETFSPITDDKGNVLKIINIGMDISDTKVMERQLRLQEREINRQMDKQNEKERELAEKQKYIEEREMEMKTLTKAMDSFVIKLELSRRGIILSSNMFFYSLMNLQDADVINKDFTEFLAPEYVTPFSTSLTILCTGKEQHEDFKLRTSASQSIIITANLFPMQNTKGDVEKILLLATVISA